MIEKLGLPAVVALAMVATANPAGAVTFLAANANSTCAAGSCFTNGSTYTITWSAADFGVKPVGVQVLKLDRSILGAKQDLTFKVGFKTADGSAVGDWGSFMIAGLAGDMVNIFGPGFVWDTHKGDLVLTLSLIAPGVGGGGGGGGGGGFFPTAVGDGPSETVAADAGVGVMNDVVDTGLLSGFDPMLRPGAVGAGAPEPRSWALMLLGFGAAGSLLRNRRRRSDLI